VRKKREFGFLDLVTSVSSRVCTLKLFTQVSNTACSRLPLTPEPNISDQGRSLHKQKPLEVTFTCKGATNALAYCIAAIVTVVKSFVKLALELRLLREVIDLVVRDRDSNRNYDRKHLNAGLSYKPVLGRPSLSRAAIS